MNVSEDPRPDGEAERQSQDEERQRDHEERRQRLNEETDTEGTVEETPSEESRIH